MLGEQALELEIAAYLADHDVFYDPTAVFVEQIGPVAVGAVVLVLYPDDIADGAEFVVVLCFCIEALGIVLEQGTAVEGEPPSGEAWNGKPLFFVRTRFRFRLAEARIFERPVVQGAAVHGVGRISAAPGVIDLHEETGRYQACLQPTDAPVFDLVAPCVRVADIVAVGSASGNDEICSVVERVVHRSLSAQRVEIAVQCILRVFQRSAVDRVGVFKLGALGVFPREFEGQFVVHLGRMAQPGAQYALVAHAECRGSTLGAARVFGNRIDQAVVGVGAV